MKQPWQLLGEVCPAASPGDEREAIECVRSIVAQLGVAEAIADRVARDLVESASTGPSGPGPAASCVSYRVFVPAGRNTAGAETQAWAFFLVTRPKYGHDPDASGRCVNLVFLYPAVQRDPSTAPES